MKEENFCFWLHGFAELTGGKRPTKEQWEMIKQHLALAKQELFIPTVLPYMSNKDHVIDPVMLFSGYNPKPLYDPSLLLKTINIT
jgi:hypothetical protein